MMTKKKANCGEGRLTHWDILAEVDLPVSGVLLSTKNHRIRLRGLHVDQKWKREFSRSTCSRINRGLPDHS